VLILIEKKTDNSTVTSLTCTGWPKK